jgi:hypothetical protein
MNKCPKCGEYIFEYEQNHHKCKPCFLVWGVDDAEENAYKIHACDEESAAEKWAEDDDCNSAEYSIVSGDTAEVFVKSPNGTIKKFEVSGEAIPTYTASEIK